MEIVSGYCSEFWSFAFHSWVYDLLEMKFYVGREEVQIYFSSIGITSCNNASFEIVLHFPLACRTTHGSFSLLGLLVYLFPLVPMPHWLYSYNVLGFGISYGEFSSSMLKTFVDLCFIHSFRFRLLASIKQNKKTLRYQLELHWSYIDEFRKTDILWYRIFFSVNIHLAIYLGTFQCLSRKLYNFCHKGDKHFCCC